jgi:hypothetical protein
MGRNLLKQMDIILHCRIVVKHVSAFVMQFKTIHYLSHCMPKRKLKQLIHLQLPLRKSKKKTPLPESASELYRHGKRRLPAKLVPNFADRGCHVVIVADPYGRILGFLDRIRYLFFQVAPQLYSRGWMDPVSEPLLLSKSGSSWNRTRICGSVARNFDH